MSRGKKKKLARIKRELELEKYKTFLDGLIDTSAKIIGMCEQDITILNDKLVKMQ